MKKNLRMLCLGLAAATFSAGFAQAENDVTSKLMNADMEKGVIGWTIDFDSHIWKKNTKNQAAKRGFHGMNNTVLENWKSDATSGLSDNTISQTVKNLPNGTYVFGAYVGASQQGSEESNRATVTGVTMFANEATVAVATDNPDNSAIKEAHTAKFNVAATVTDGTLTVGIKAESTNANYLVIDNATLYYFGDMDAAAALDEMAKIDMAATVAIADTCFAHHMNADTLAAITEAKAAAEAVATADAAWQADEDLYWAIYKATRSIGDYRSFNNAIAAAEVVAAGEYSVDDLEEALAAAIEAAKATYEAAAADRTALNEQKAALNEAAAIVALDSCYVVLEEFLGPLVEELPEGDAPGEYSESKIAKIEELMDDALAVVDDAYEANITALQARHQFDSLYAEIQAVLDNPNSVDAFPFTVTASQEPNADGRYEFTSKVYTVNNPVTTLRFTFLDSFCPNGSGKGDPVFVALGEFYMYNADGELIELSAENFSTNAQEASEGPIANICDGDISTYFHSDWHGNVAENHYIEVSLPEGLDLTSFSFGWIDRGNRQNIPLVVEVSSLSTATADLMAAISAAKNMNAYRGTAPGFYNADLSAFYAAIAAAEALVGTEASDDEVYAAIEALEEQQSKLDELSVVMPEAGKQYRIVSAGPFFEKQGVHKAWTAYSDTAVVNQVWWETAHPDSADQVFTFEALANDEGKNYYYVKHVATGLYVGTPVNDEGEELNAIGLIATPDTVELSSLGYGQFGLYNSGMIHAGDHNSGVASTNAGSYGGVRGVSSGMCKWTTGAYDCSAWYIREMQGLPYATKNMSELNFQSESINLYEGVNTLVLEADKDCAFADFVVYDVLGNAISASVNAAGKVATVTLDTTAVESFSFAFTNAEGVATVSINGSISKLSELQTAYDETVAVAPEKGHAVGQYSDLKEYEAALKAAEALLANGGSEDAIQQAINDLDSAVAHLQVNLPLADKTYFIVSGHDAFFNTHGVDVALYVKKDGTPAWSYVGTSSPNYLWKFIDKGELVNGAPAFYLQNVATGTYMGSADGFSTPLEMVADTAATQPFRIDAWGEGVVTICDSRYSDGNIHMNGHGGGANAFGNLVYWSSTTGTASAMKIVESEYYIWKLTDIEDIEIVDEFVAPAQKGIYDLFGRRIDAPAATGIYIVDGKKRVIKK